MNPHVALEQFQRLLAEQLSASERQALEAHVDTCNECQQLLAELLDQAPDDTVDVDWRRLQRGWPESAPPVTVDFLRRLGEQSAVLTPQTGEGPQEQLPCSIHFPEPPTVRGPLGQLESYHILAELGRGACGHVFKVYDEQLDCLVALKVLKPELAASASDRARFEREARAAAAVRHDHVVTIHRVGNTPGFALPYLVMEYLDGEPLSERLKRQGALAPREAAEVVRQVASGLAAAHTRGLVHRDIKPSNIMLEGRTGRAKITDFGLARPVQVGPDKLTQSGAIVGTPPYLSPEQIVTPQEVDPRSDVYSLGVVLYEVLTGETPFRGQMHLILQQVVTNEPVPPSRLQRLPRNLETITLKCLAKEPARRYQMAQELAEDLHRFLAGAPVRARPVGYLEWLWRWCRRNPALAVAGGSAAFLLVAIAGIAVAWAVHANRLNKGVQDALDASERRRSESYLDGGLAAAERGEAALGLLWMTRALETAPASAEDLSWPIRVNLASWSRHVFALTNCMAAPPERLLAFHPDGLSAWTIDERANIVRRWDTATSQFAGPGLKHPGPVTAVVVDASGNQLMTGCEDGAVRIWNPAAGKIERSFPGKGVVRAMALSSNGRYLLIGRSVPGDLAEQTALQVWDAKTGQPIGSPIYHRDRIKALAYSPDSSTVLVVPRFGKAIARLDMSTGQFLGIVLPHPALVNAIAFSPDGKTVLTAGEDRTARLWEWPSGRPLAVLYHREPVGSVMFGQDRRTLWTASAGDAIRVWEGVALPEPLQTLEHAHRIRVLEVSPDGTRTVTGSDDHVVQIWRVGPAGLILERQLRHGSPMASATFSPDGELLVTSTHQDKEALVWEVKSGGLLAVLPHDAPVRKAVFSPDGTRIATASYHPIVRVWDTATRKPAFAQPICHEKHVTAVEFSSDGRLLITAGADNMARIWDAVTGASLGQTGEHGSDVLTIAISPDSRMLITGSRDGTARRWDAPTGREIAPALQHGYAVWEVAVSPDSQTILTGSWDHTARLWDAATGERRGTLLRHGGPIRAASFGWNGRLVLTASEDGTARVWDASTGRALGPPLPHAAEVYVATFGPAPEWVATAGVDRTARLWLMPSPLEGSVEQTVLWSQVLTGMELDAWGSVQVLDTTQWRDRNQQLDSLRKSFRASRGSS